MKKMFWLFLIAVISCSIMYGCAEEDPKAKEYGIKEELVEVYQINDEIEAKLFDFFELSETAHEQYLKSNDTEEFMNSVYDGFIEFNEDLTTNADINARIEADREANRHLASYSIDYFITVEPMLALPLQYAENPGSIHADDVLSAVNKISDYFCGVNIFENADQQQ